MYETIASNVIVTKNNNFELAVTPFIENSETEYILTGEDKLILTVKPYNYSKKAVIKKELTALDYDDEDRLIFSFTPEDTCNLVPFGYVYDVVLYTAEKEFYTIIDTSLFRLLPSVTDYPVDKVIENDDTDNSNTEDGE